MRERAFFYINMLSTKGDESFLQEGFFDFSGELSSPDGAHEKDEVCEFVFDGDQVIDIEALEQFVMDKRDTLVQSEQPLHIDITQMMVSKKSLEAAKRGPNAIKQHMEVEVQEMNQ